MHDIELKPKISNMFFKLLDDPAERWLCHSTSIRRAANAPALNDVEKQLQLTKVSDHRYFCR